MESKRMPTWASPGPTQANPARPRSANDANLPAFFQMKGQDGSAGYTGANPDDNKLMTYEDDQTTWTKLWGPDAPGIKMDKVSLFSVTPASLADEMSKVLLSLPGISSTSTITDATACVGGNSVSFARFFEHVQSIEMDPARCDMLHNNVEYCRRNNETSSQRKLIGTVRIYCENCLEVVQRMRQDIVFLDPPWGGKDYRSKAAVSLFLGSKPLHEVVLFCLKASIYVAMKLPKNADQSHLQSDPRIDYCLVKTFPNFFLLVVKSRATILKKASEPCENDTKAESLLMSLVKTQQFHDVLYKSARATATNNV